MRYKPIIILRNDIGETQSGFHKIIRFFTHIHHYCNNSKKEYGKKESGQKFFKYVPVDLFHTLFTKIKARKHVHVKRMLIEENLCFKGPERA